MKDTMKALVAGKQGGITVETLPVPSISDDQALVRMLACGVCNGTDAKLIHHTFKGFDQYPAVLGHEGVGEVVKTGSRVTGMKPGDRVMLPFQEGINGGCNSGWGAFAEYAVVTDRQALAAGGFVPGMPDYPEGCLAQTVLSGPLYDDPVAAAMVVTFREVLSAVRRFGMRAGETAAVFGAGPVGLSFVRFLRLLGLTQVIAVDINDQKVEDAKKLGAHAAFNSTSCDIAEEILRLVPGGLDHVVDAVGLPSVINQAMRMIRPYGQLCRYGISPKSSMEIVWEEAPYNWSLNFLQWPSKQEEGEAHGQIEDWIRQKKLNPYDYISDVMDFSQILDAFALVAKPLPETKKIIIRFAQ